MKLCRVKLDKKIQKQNSKKAETQTRENSVILAFGGWNFSEAKVKVIISKVEQNHKIDSHDME